MDGQRIDAWARALASGLPRRDALKAVLGAGLATVVTRASLGPLSANTCDECGGDCTSRGGTCGGHDECCGTDVCLFTECTACLQHGDNACRLGAHDCCPGLSCRSEGPGVSCQPDKNDDDEERKKKKHKKHKNP
jgi:hypothetical protein